MIYSPYAADYEAGFIVCEDGTLKPKKMGCMVLTIEEGCEALRKRGLLK